MLSKKLALCSLIAFSTLAHARAKPSESCGSTPPAYRASTRHIEGKGIGYTKGYTSVDLFIAPAPTLTAFCMPFIDTRLHVFNSGRIATNIGVGLRFLGSSFVYGVNTYYDYRETSHQKFNQYSLGFEALGKVWDFRLSGYLPVGAKTSPFYNPRFGYFTGNRLILKGDTQFAMKGLNAEAGIHIKKMKDMEFYGAFGPYYFEKRGQNAIGGKVRLSGTFLNHIKLEVSGSYDPIFHTIGQGELSFVFPFGPSKKIKSQKGTSCSKALRLRERALQPVDRFEIMVLNKGTTHATAINPTTGLPYNFLFVDNTSHSDGTYESPYHTLLDAQHNSHANDVIYIFPGDNTSRGLASGITLKTGQKLFGSGASHTLSTTKGSALIPAQSTTLPLLTQAVSFGIPANPSVVILADNTEVAGLHIHSTVGDGISSQPLFSVVLPVSNVLIRDNVIEASNAGTAYGILVYGKDNVTITNNNVTSDFRGIKVLSATNGYVLATVSSNTVQGSGNGVVLQASNDASSMDAYISNNTVTTSDIGIEAFADTTSGFLSSIINANNVSQATREGIYAFSSNSTGALSTQILNNVTTAGLNTGANNAGILIYSDSSSGPVSSIIAYNTSSAAGDTSAGIYVASSGSSGLISSSIYSNFSSSSGTGSYSIWMQPQGSSDSCLSLINNTADSSISLDNSGCTGVFKLSPNSLNNTAPSFVTSGTILSGSCN